MAKGNDRYDLSCKPVCAISLHDRISRALGLPPANDTRSIVEQPFPDVGSDNFRDRYLQREVLRKYPGFKLGIDTRAAAITSFLEDEAVNAETNDRLCSYDPENPDVRLVLDLAARKVVAVLGKFRWDWWREGLRFGPGATTRISGETTGPARKLSGIPHVNQSAYHLMQAVFSVTPQWKYGLLERDFDHCSVEPGTELPVDVKVDVLPEALKFTPTMKDGLVIMNYDRFETVLKNALTDRTIGIPPCMNVYGQLGAGYVMRKKMFPWGINLNDQSINKRKALQASKDGRNATLDVKSASNSVVKVLVWLMVGNHSHDWSEFDPTWYALLDALRTEGCLIDGKPHEYELFSAMGNGFTFELESLLFWALCKASCEVLGVRADVSVYGDDLIVPVEVVEFLTKVLAYCGFRLNANKSFSSTQGPLFRESCGGHYLDGRDVTPFYVDAALNTADQVLLLANNIVRWARDPSTGLLDGRLRPVWQWVVGHLSSDYLNLQIPFGEENDGLISNFESARPSIAYLGNPEIPGCPRPPRAQLTIGYRVKTAAMKSRERIVDGPLGLLVWHYEASKRRFVPPQAHLPVRPYWVPWNPGKGKYGKPGFEAAMGRKPMSLPREEPHSTVELANGRKKSMTLGKRLVSWWPNVGPWVCEDEVYTYGPSWLSGESLS